MIRLELTLTETERLRRYLADQLLTQADETLQTVWTKLVEAEAEATELSQCPVCQQWFYQDKTGRTGQYCSAACKQKAYRQRRQAWRRQFRPARRT
jgi:hypothetical protein